MSRVSRPRMVYSLCITSWPYSPWTGGLESPLSRHQITVLRLKLNYPVLDRVESYQERAFDPVIHNHVKPCYLYHTINHITCYGSLITFLLIEQNLQSVADAGKSWLTISLFTGTFSFFKDACSRDDSLTAITCHTRFSRNN